MPRFPIAAVLAAVLALVVTPPAPAHALAPGAGAPSPVNRYWQPSDRDWISVAAHASSRAPLSSRPTATRRTRRRSSSST